MGPMIAFTSTRLILGELNLLVVKLTHVTVTEELALPWCNYTSISDKREQWGCNPLNAYGRLWRKKILFVL